MEEIKIGEYVRTKQGYICKVKSVYKDMIWWCDLDWISEKDIVNHSNNIIDLIEKGDYVKVESEGYEITGIVDLTIPPLKIFIDGEEYLEDEIKSIVTKESLKNVEYKVED